MLTNIAPFSLQAAAKFDPKLETEAKEWLEQITGLSIGPSLVDGLKNGVILCKYVKEREREKKKGRYFRFLPLFNLTSSPLYTLEP